MIVTEPREIIAKYVADGVGQYRPWDVYSTLAYISDNEIKAAVVYNDYSYTSISAHIRATLLTKEFIFSIFDYPFRELQVQRVTLNVGKKNKKARKLAEDLGFRYEGCMRNAIKGDSLIIYGMLREECKWLKIS